MLVIIGLSMGGAARGLEINTEFHIGNLGFARDRAADATDYPATYPWGLSLSAGEQINEDLTINTGFDIDPVLHNIAYTRLTFAQQYFTLEVGPFFGLFNSTNKLMAPGISTGIRLDFPGLLFFEFRSDSSIGSRLITEGDYLQESNEISAGLYVLNAITSLNLHTKSYTSITADHEIIDGFTEYSFKADIYQKNVPYRVLLSFAYQIRGKSYIDVVTRETVAHQLNSLILGTRIDLRVNEFLALMADLESSIFSFGSAGSTILSLPASGISAYLFNVRAGVTVSIN